jgi:hypothetical protein
MKLFSVAFFAVLVSVAACLANPFDQTLEDGNISIHITSPNTSEKNTFTLEPKGLEKVNDPITVAVESAVTRVFLADMDGDNSPELFIVLTNPGSGSYGEVLAYSTNGKKSLTPIMIEAPSPKDLDGYMGHDAYEVMENTFVRRFPVYKKGDTNSSPSGGFRQFQYKLKPGEAAWQMKIDRVESY